jgi:septum formation protein
LTCALILASGSPRRHAFLNALGLSYAIHVADVDEESREGEPPHDLVARLSGEKACAVAEAHPEATVIGADTIVTLDEHLLGKPAGPAEAMEMLRRLRGRAHVVYSGVTVCAPGVAPRTAVVGSTVWMRGYAEKEIAAYVASGDPLDKAGAYAIQNESFRPVERMAGCFASVMGLPVQALADLLGEAGVHPPVAPPVACEAVTGMACCGGRERLYRL